MAKPTDHDAVDPVARAIGENIQSAMTRLGINNTILGEAWGAGRQNVQHWVKGRHLPKASELPRLCELLAINANELLSVPPRPALTGEALASHRLWLIERAAQTKQRKQQEVARVAPSKSRPRKLG